MSVTLTPTVPTEALSDLMLRRLHLVVAPPGPATEMRRFTFLAELAGLGYRVSNPEQFSDAVLDRYPQLLQTLRAMRGGDVPYVPLFQGFPAELPDDHRYFMDRLLGHLAQITGLTKDHSWIFDLEKFGADPVYQMQRADLFERAREEQTARAGDTHTEWISLELVSPDEADARARSFLQAQLYAGTSIPAALRDDVRLLLAGYGAESVDPTRVVFRETRTYLARFFWERSDWLQAADYCTTPTDLLRLFAALTDTDVSLATEIRYPKLTRSQRRFVLQRLEAAPALEEDLNRYRRLWLAVGRGLHVMAEADAYPRCGKAFSALVKGRIPTFSSQVEAALRQGDLQATLALLSTRPGTLARKLAELLKRFPDQGDLILDTFQRVGSTIPLRTLLVLESHFHALHSGRHRSIINKKGKILVQPRPAPGFSTAVASRVTSAVRDVIRQQLQLRESWIGKKVWIDPKLGRYTVPLQLRKASDALLILGRGTRVPLPSTRALRLFVYWKEAQRRTDLDLSLIQFDENMAYTGHVSYSRLTGRGIVHSGDIQSAPLGAAEFIDIDLKLLGREAVTRRFLAPQVFRYTGDRFEQMTCYTGWMAREQVDATYATFDIKTVQNKLDLSGPASYAIPFLVDLREQEIIYVDLYVHSVESGNRVEGAISDISSITREMARQLETRPTVQQLALHHANARGASLVEKPGEADLTFGVADGDYCILRMERILAELL